jgi:hypothetical protein
VLSGSLPTGLGLSSAGVLSGIAAGADTAVTYNFVLRATDSIGTVGTQSYTVTINPRDRAIARQPPTVLIVYDLSEGPLYAYAPYRAWYFTSSGWQVLNPGTYYSRTLYAENGGPDVSVVGLAQTVAQRESSLGFLTQVVTSYSILNSMTREQMNRFAHIWDLGYKTTPNASAKAKYIQYLQDGGAIFLLGENVQFLQRDNGICEIINEAGGNNTSVRTDGAGLGTVGATTASEFLLANSRSDITFYAPNYFNSYGTGTPVANTGFGPAAVMWRTGSLSNARSGAIVSVLDINFLLNPVFAPNAGDAQWQPWFVDNLSIILNRK